MTLWTCIIISLPRWIALWGWLWPAYGRYPIKFILAEFLSYLGVLGVMCVGNGSHFRTPILMCNITFQVHRLSTSVFNKYSEKIGTLIFVVKSLKGFGSNNVGTAPQMVVKHYISIGQCIVLSGVSFAGMLKRHQHNAAVGKHGTITKCCFDDGPASKTVDQHWNSIVWMPRVCVKYTTLNRPGDRLELGQRRRRLTSIEPAMGCNTGPTLNRNFAGRPTSSVGGTS